MSNINSYNGGSINNGGASAPKMDLGNLKKYSYNPKISNSGSNYKNDKTSDGSFTVIAQQISDYNREPEVINLESLMEQEVTVQKIEISQGYSVQSPETEPVAESPSLLSTLYDNSIEKWKSLGYATLPAAAITLASSPSLVSSHFLFNPEAAATVGCSVINGIAAFGEGVLELGEGLLDTGTIIGAGAVSVWYGIKDGWNWLGSKLTGKEFNSETAAFWTDKVWPQIGKDKSGAAYDKLYSTEFMKSIDEHSVGFMKRGGVGYDVFKTVGYVTGTAALGIGGGGLGFATGNTFLTASNTSTLIAGLSKAGNKFEEKYNNLSAEEKVDGGALGKVLLNGTLAGSWEATTWYLTYGNGMKNASESVVKLFKGKEYLANNPTIVKDFLGKKVFNKETASNILGKILPNSIKVENLLKYGVQFVKPWGTYGIDLATTGSSKEWYTVLTEGFVNAGAAFIYDLSPLTTWIEQAGAKSAQGLTHKSYAASVIEQGHDDLVGMMPKQTNLTSELVKTIKEFRYDKGDYAAHYTRLILEGAKKAGGTLVKKWISEPLIDAYKYLLAN